MMKTAYSDGIFYASNTRINPFLMTCIKEIKPSVAIDFGCGIGTNAGHLEQLGWMVFVVEKEELALVKLREKFRPEQIFATDITMLDFKDVPKCSLAICNYVLQHLTIQAAEKFIEDISCRVEKGGMIVLSIFERINAIDFAKIKLILESNGFSLLRSKTWTRWDSDHGPRHFHKGVESCWILN